MCVDTTGVSVGVHYKAITNVNLYWDENWINIDVLLSNMHTTLWSYSFKLFWYGWYVVSFDKLPPCREVGIPSTSGCALVNSVRTYLRIDEMMYYEYWIVIDQWSLTIMSDFHFQFVQLQVLLLVEELYLLHRLAFLKGLQLKCYHHIDYSFQYPGVVAVGNLHLCSYG